VLVESVLAEAGIAAAVVGDDQRSWSDGAFDEPQSELALRSGTTARRTNPSSGVRISDADGGLVRRHGCGHDGQRCRVDHMPTATTADEAIGRVIKGSEAVRLSN
jgi:hypothetical protein